MSDSTPRFTTTELLLVALGLPGLVGTWTPPAAVNLERGTAIG